MQSLPFSTVPFLFLVQVLAIGFATRRGAHAGAIQHPGWIYALLGALVSWGALTTYLAVTGVYLTDRFLQMYPTIWIPFIPVAIVVIPALTFGSAREAVSQLIDATPTQHLIAIHALRILAFGTLYKAWNHTFSQSFAVFVGIPDLLFGLSALVMLWLIRRGIFVASGFMLWNLLGVLVILPGAPIVAQRGLPGMFHASTETPGIATIYEFPMALAPTLVVPTFVMINMFVLMRIIERKASGKW
jgi:hypothetical protein